MANTAVPPEKSEQSSSLVSPMSMTPIPLLTDTEIRTALRSRLMASDAAERDTVVLDELGVFCGQARIDLALVNGSLHGYEIKSNRDSLRRLGGQMALYSRVLDKCVPLSVEIAGLA